MLVVFPGCFHVLSLAVAVVAMACCEQEEAAVGQLKQREGEFGQILEAIKRSEEDEVRSFQFFMLFIQGKLLFKCAAVKSGSQQGGALTRA